MLQYRGLIFFIKPPKHRCYSAEVFIAGSTYYGIDVTVLKKTYLVFSFGMANRTLFKFILVGNFLRWLTLCGGMSRECLLVLLSHNYL